MARRVEAVTVGKPIGQALDPARAAVRSGWRAGTPWLAVLPLLGLLAVAGVLALGLGSVAVPPETTARILLAKAVGVPLDVTWTPGQEAIVAQVRLPRVLLAAVAGAALAVAGAVYQGLFRNPLGDPYLLGVAPGAGLGATAIIVFGADLGLAWAQLLPAAAFVGALGATAVIYALARVERTTPVATLLLAGVAVGSFLSAVTSFLMFARPQRLQNALFWLFGSFSQAGWSSLGTALPYVVVGFAIAALCARPLNLLLLDEEQAQHLGVQVERTKLVLVVAATLLSAGTVAVSGLIGFVGLVAPHAARLLWGPDYRALLPTSALLGALFMLLADLAARTVFAPGELPVGVVSALCGGPFFLYLLRQRKHVRSL